MHSSLKYDHELVLPEWELFLPDIPVNMVSSGLLIIRQLPDHGHYISAPFFANYVLKLLDNFWYLDGISSLRSDLFESLNVVFSFSAALTLQRLFFTH